MGTTPIGTATRASSAGGSIRWMSQSRLPRMENRAYLPLTRSPCRVTTTFSSSILWGSYVPVSQLVMRPAP